MFQDVVPSSAFGTKLVEDQMRRLWVFLLATIAFSAGAFVGIAYSGGTGSFASFRVACELLNSAEAAGMLGRAQRADLVDRVVREMQIGRAHV